MIGARDGWVEIAEVNPPTYPDMSHLLLEGAWERVLVTDNVFGKIRVSPYAYAARLTHDVPSVQPTVVVSTRDRNIRAIESEVRGALGNGVRSFLVVVGDTIPAVEHLAGQVEIVEHLVDLQAHLGPFGVGMPIPFSREVMQRRIDSGAQFFVAGPLLDPATVDARVARLQLQPGDPPVILMIIPPFSAPWVERMEGVGAAEATPGLKEQLAGLDPVSRRGYAWDRAAETARRARDAGCGGVVLMGLKQETVIDEAVAAWRRRFPRSERRAS
jgi:5,10-methylenetetrahydrofolate reductase